MALGETGHALYLTRNIKKCTKKKKNQTQKKWREEKWKKKNEKLRQILYTQAARQVVKLFFYCSVRLT